MIDFIRNISPIELIVIALILLLLFGSKVLTSLAKAAGETLKEIKKVKSTITDAVGDDDKPRKSEKGVSK